MPVTGVVSDGKFSSIEIQGPSTAPATPGAISFITAAGTYYYLHVDNTGKLRISSAPPVASTDGTVVGTQS